MMALPLPVLPIVSPRTVLPAPTLTKQHWQSCLDQVFHVPLPSGQSLTLRLIEVSGLGDKPGTSREPYSLLFRGPPQPAFEQSLIELEHDAMGRLALFLVPLGPDDRGMRYEAIFT
jgi:hypothetical protein